MQGCYAVDVVGSNGGQIGHADCLIALLIDDRDLAQDLLVARIFQAHLLQEAAVDFVDQLQVAG